MRNLLLVIVLCIGGYWLYEHYLVTPAGSGSATSGDDSSSESDLVSGGFSMPDPVAWKETVRMSSKPGEIVMVALVQGNRWRTEARRLPSSQLVVDVFDGVRLVSSNPNVKEAIAVDPASAMRTLYTEINQAKQEATGVRDGHSCWLFKDPKGGKDEVWVDRETRFPVLIRTWSTTGEYGEAHFQMLKSDFTILGATCFDTGNRAPMLTPFLKP